MAIVTQTTAAITNLGAKAADAAVPGIGQAVNAIVGIIKTAISTVGDAVQQLTGFLAKLRTQMVSAVEAYKPFQVELFNRRLLDLQAVFGRVLLPVLLTTIKYIRQLSDYLYTMSFQMQGAVAGLAKFAIVLGLILTAVTSLGGTVAIITALAVAIGVLVFFAPLIIGVTIALVAILAPFAAIGFAIMAVVAALGALIYAFSQTEGGANFFSKAFKAVGDAFDYVWRTIKEVWEELKPFRDVIEEIFSAFGDALSELLEALKPVAFIVLASVFAVLTAVVVALGAVAAAVTAVIWGLVKIMTYFFNQMRKLLGLKEFEFAPAEQKSSFGLAAQGGHITSDVAGLKTSLEEVILANTGRDQPDTTQKEVPGLVKGISTDLKDLVTWFKSKAEGLKDKAQNGAPITHDAVIDWMLKQILG